MVVVMEVEVMVVVLVMEVEVMVVEVETLTMQPGAMAVLRPVMVSFINFSLVPLLSQPSPRLALQHILKYQGET